MSPAATELSTAVSVLIGAAAADEVLRPRASCIHVNGIAQLGEPVLGGRCGLADHDGDSPDQVDLVGVSPRIRGQARNVLDRTANLLEIVDQGEESVVALAGGGSFTSVVSPTSTATGTANPRRTRCAG